MRPEAARHFVDRRAVRRRSDERYGQTAPKPVAAGIIPAPGLEQTPALKRGIQPPNLGPTFETEDECGLALVTDAVEGNGGLCCGHAVPEEPLFAATWEEVPSPVARGLRAKDMIAGARCMLTASVYVSPNSYRAHFRKPVGPRYG